MHFLLPFCRRSTSNRMNESVKLHAPHRQPSAIASFTFRLALCFYVCVFFFWYLSVFSVYATHSHKALFVLCLKAFQWFILCCCVSFFFLLSSSEHCLHFTWYFCGLLFPQSLVICWLSRYIAFFYCFCFVFSVDRPFNVAFDQLHKTVMSRIRHVECVLVFPRQFLGSF